MNCTLHYGFHHNMCPRCGTLPGVKPQMEEPAENTDAQTINTENTDARASNTEPSEMEERAEMEKTMDMEEASMVVTPWRGVPGSASSGSTSRGDHEEPRAQGHKRRLEEPDKRFLRLTKCQGCNLYIPAHWLMQCPRCRTSCGV